MSLGLALAGGGLKGLAYVGAIKALRELNVKIDYLSGASSGSIFTTFYAVGLTPEEIQEKTMQHYKELVNIKNRNILKAGITYMTSGVAKIEGLMSGKNIEDIVASVINEKNITNMNEVKIPYAIVTVDTISTKECIFLSRDFGLKNTDEIDYLYNVPIKIATRASMSFPGVYTPCQYENYNFIDGGTKDNLPVQVLKDMGADKVLALSFKIDDYEPKENLFGILLRTVDIFSLKDVRRAQKIADLAIEIDCKGTTLLEIDDSEKVVNTGYNTIMQNKEKILDLLK
jgi:NTE family protein